MWNLVVTAVSVVVVAARITLSIAIHEDRTGRDESLPGWLSTKWRPIRGPLTERGRLLWRLRLLCVGVGASVILLWHYAA